MSCRPTETLKVPMAKKCLMLSIVTARGGSKRLPGKNLKTLAGRSLIAHTAEFLASEGFLNTALLSTDNTDIADEGRRCGLSVPFLRPPALATDDATSSDAVLHALNNWIEFQGEDPEFLALLQPTSPLRRNGLLRDAVALLQRASYLNSVVAMTRLHVPVSFVFVESSSGAVEPVSGQGARGLVPTGSLYVARTQAFRAQGSMYAAPVGAIEVKATEAVDIDTAEDLLVAEAMIEVKNRVTSQDIQENVQ